MKRINRTFMINPELYIKLKTFAARKNIAYSHLIEYIIATFLKDPYPVNLSSTEQLNKEIPE